MLPPNFPGYRTYCPYTRDVARARRLVAASGTRGASIVVWSSPAFEGPGWGAYFVRVLRALGYRARLKLVADDDYNAAIDPASNTQAGLDGWNADYIARWRVPRPDARLCRHRERDQLFAVLRPCGRGSDAACVRPSDDRSGRGTTRPGPVPTG